jgi:hypothetical protein
MICCYIFSSGRKNVQLGSASEINGLLIQISNLKIRKKYLQMWNTLLGFPKD